MDFRECGLDLWKRRLGVWMRFWLVLLTLGFLGVEGEWEERGDGGKGEGDFKSRGFCL